MWPLFPATRSWLVVPGLTAGSVAGAVVAGSLVAAGAGSVAVKGAVTGDTTIGAGGVVETFFFFPFAFAFPGLMVCGALTTGTTAGVPAAGAVAAGVD
jgi:hypothetical protein